MVTPSIEDLEQLLLQTLATRHEMLRSTYQCGINTVSTVARPPPTKAITRTANHVQAVSREIGTVVTVTTARELVLNTSTAVRQVCYPAISPFHVEHCIATVKIDNHPAQPPPDLKQ
jgi:hypothetical protein